MMGAHRITPVRAVSECGSTVIDFPSISHAADEGFSYVAVRNCIKGRQSHHAGYRWLALGRELGVPVTPRLQQAADLHLQGLRNGEVAEVMGISKATAATYISQGRNLGIIPERSN